MQNDIETILSGLTATEEVPAEEQTTETEAPAETSDEENKEEDRIASLNKQLEENKAKFTALEEENKATSEFVNKIKSAVSPEEVEKNEFQQSIANVSTNLASALGLEDSEKISMLESALTELTRTSAGLGFTASQEKAIKPEQLDEMLKSREESNKRMNELEQHFPALIQTEAGKEILTGIIKRTGKFDVPTIRAELNALGFDYTKQVQTAKAEQLESLIMSNMSHSKNPLEGLSKEQIESLKPDFVAFAKANLNDPSSVDAFYKATLEEQKR